VPEVIHINITLKVLNTSIVNLVPRKRPKIRNKKDDVKVEKRF